jgi:hypothetical protein
MPVGVALVDLRRDLRAETGQSLNMAQGVQSQATQDNQLDRQQRELWNAYDWPHLKYWVDVPVSAGQAVYDYPAQMPFDQINYLFWSMEGWTSWKPVMYGADGFMLRPGLQPGTPVRWFNVVTVDPDTNLTNPIGQLELIPVPNSNGTLRFQGQAPCNPLVADTDTCILDSKAIVLFAAAEILATQKAEVASIKLQKAQNFLRKLLSNQGADKRRNYNMGGKYRDSFLGARPFRHYVPGIDYIP